MSRPHLSWSIDQLETEFDRARTAGDEAALDRLLHELGFRERVRAKALRQRIVQALDTAGGVPEWQSPRAEAPPDLSFEPLRLKPGATPQPKRAVIDLPPVRLPSSENPRRAPSRQKPSPATAASRGLHRQRADDVLSAWIALEVLSPPQ